MRFEIGRPLLLLVLLALISAHQAAIAQTPPPCGLDTRKSAGKAICAHAARKLRFWEQALRKPLEERIGGAPPELVEFLALDNIYNEHPNKPRAAAPAPDFVRDVRTALGELPAQVRNRVDPKLVGIYFMADIGGTGFNDQIYDAQGKPVAGFVVLDPSVLEKQTANSWATWKESTPFKPQPGFELKAQIETERDDNRKNAIQYILLHELGHVLSVGSNVHPSWNVFPKDMKSTAAYPFFRLSWSISKDRRSYVALFDDIFPQRKDVVFYFGAKLPASQMLGTYSNLERTSFATLYATTNPFDDFAEAFVNYVHTVMMRRPFEIRIYQDGKVAKTFESCWEDKRCAEKRRILEQMLEIGVDPAHTN